MTGVEVLFDDAALARSLQLAADIEYAESELARCRARRLMARFDNHAQRVTRSTRGDPFGLPDPPGADRSSRTRRTCEVDPIVKDQRKRESRRSSRRSQKLVPSWSQESNDLSLFTRQRSRSSERSTPSVVSELFNEAALASMFSDGSMDEAKNKNLLFVPCEINDRLVEMMVDTGAQTSVISTPLMQKLCLDKKLNTQKQGVAAGVGLARIIGRIENCPVQIGHAEFLLYFAVLDVETDMMILGIDQMRRFNCLVDLQNDKLIFGGKGGVEVDFFKPHSSSSH